MAALANGLLTDQVYGSDQNGLVWGYSFTPDAPATVITSAEVIDLLANDSPQFANQFVWLHFSLSNSVSETWMRQNLQLPDAFYESLVVAESSTRVEQTGDSLLAVIHDILFDFKFDASAVASTSLYIGPRLMVSARLQPLRSVDQLRAQVRSGHVFHSPVGLLAHLLLEQADVLVGILRQSTARVDQIEDKLLAGRAAGGRSELGSLRRLLVRLQRLLSPEPAALFRLLNRPPEWVTRDDLQELRQAAEEFSAAVGDAAVLMERVKLIQEEMVALVNEQTNRTLFVLTVVTVLALPINMVAGLFGMNVGGIPLAANSHGFWLIACILLVLTGVLAHVAFNRRQD